MKKKKRQRMQAKINPNLNHEYLRFLFSSSCFILINFPLRAQPSQAESDSFLLGVAVSAPFDTRL